MTVLLVHPPLANLFSRGQPAYYFREQGLFPPLGLLSIAAYLRAHTDLTVEVVDLRLLPGGTAGFDDLLRRRRPTLVGISCLTHFLYDAVVTARRVKESFPSTPVVFGGHHTTLYPRETLALDAVDAVVLGAGERVFAELALEHRRTGRLARRPGVLLAADEPDEQPVPAPVVEELDSLPLPARELLPVRAYRYPAARRRVCTVMMTSTGCPHRCTFCDARGGRTRYRSPERVVDEMAHCVRLGVEEILIQDENFAQDRGRVMAIVDELHRRRVRVAWSFESRVDHVDRELIRAVRGAGCYSVHFGVESGSAEVLRRTRKGITLGQVRRAFRVLREEGLATTASFILGLPGDDRQSVERTIDFARELDPAYVQFAIAIVLPGTPMYDKALRRGWIEGDPWRDFAERPRPDFEPPGYYDHFSRAELEELLHRAYRRFYLRPGYALRRLWTLTTVRGLWDHARIAGRIARRR